MYQDPLALNISDASRNTIISISPEEYRRDVIQTENYYAYRTTNKVEFSCGYYYEHGSGVVGEWYASAKELQALSDLVLSFTNRVIDTFSFTAYGDDVPRDEAKGDDPQKDEFFTVSATRLNGRISFSFQILDLYSEDRVYAEKTDLSEDEFKPYADTLILWSKSFPIIPDEELDALEDRRYTRLVPEDVKYLQYETNCMDCMELDSDSITDVPFLNDQLLVSYKHPIDLINYDGIDDTVMGENMIPFLERVAKTTNIDLTSIVAELYERSQEFLKIFGSGDILIEGKAPDLETINHYLQSSLFQDYR